MVVPEGETPVPESYWKTLSTCRGSVLGGSCYCIKAKHHVSARLGLQVEILLSEDNSLSD